MWNASYSCRDSDYKGSSRSSSEGYTLKELISCCFFCIPKKEFMLYNAPGFENTLSAKDNASKEPEAIKQETTPLNLK
ncbi:MAG: hypothetical protein HKM04_03370 [Legionellales bacterium]|nr:hypothetical protein [Legionellales bacterium]